MRPTSGRARHVLLGLTVLLGVAVRLGLLLHWPRRLNADESTVGMMALHVQRGEFPAFFLSHGYMGALESYLAGPVLLLFGPSAGGLKVPVFLASCLFVPVTFLVGQRIAGWPGGLLAALLAAVAPPFLPVFGNYPMLGYMELAIVGSLVLLLTLDLVTADGDERRRARKLWALGLLAGLGWWLNPMMLSYLAAAGLALLLRPAVWRSHAVWGVPLAFLLGSLPYWIWNLTHSFRSFVMFRKGAQGDVTAGATKAFELAQHIAGVRGVLTDPVPVLSVAAGVVYLALVGVLLVDLARPTPRRAGVGLLLLFAALHLVAFSVSSYAEFAADRYLFPLYSALPVLTAVGLLLVWRWSRPLAAAALALLLLNNVLALGKTVHAYEVARRTDWWKPEPIEAFLESETLRRAYAHHRIAFRLTFETGERIVAADPFFSERYPAYLAAVEGSPRVAYILSDRLDPTVAQVESALRAIGATYRRQDLGEFSVLYDFRPPFDGTPVSLPPRAWRAEALPAGTDPGRAFDREADTAWLSEAFLQPGMSYRLDLGEVRPVAGITVLPVHPRIGLPKGYRIEVSRDRTTWDTVASVPDFAVTLKWRGGQPRLERTGQLVSQFAPRPARYLRIVQTGQSREEWWALGEIFVYGPGDGAAGNRVVAAAHVRDGLRLEKARRWKAAVAAYERAVRLDPDWDEPHTRMIHVYWTVRLPLDGSDPYRRGLVFEQLGMWAKAARQYETLLSQGTEPARAGDVQNRLREVYRRQGTSE